jgi:hypothetical protein
MTNYKKEEEMDSIINDSIEHSPNISQEAPVKRGRGRPAKYAPEERKERYKELSKTWHKEHKEEYKEYQHNYYTENSETILKQSNEYHIRARNALRLLTEMIEEDINIPSEKYKTLICDLVKNKKIIYA